MWLPLLPGGTKARRRQAIADVTLRAAACGYQVSEAVGRLYYATFVSRERRYVYVETPKVACTAFKRLIVEIERDPFDWNARPYMREARMDMLIHQRDYVSVPSVLDLSNDERKAIFDGGSDWFVFALVRNPFSRLVSVFENKIRLADPDFPRLTPPSGESALYGDRLNVFSAFAEDVAKKGSGMSENPHVRSQCELLLPKMIRYTEIFHIESIRSAIDAFNAHLQLHGVLEPVRLPKQNASPSLSWRSYYNARSAGLIAKLYEEDFITFGYDADDWQAPEGAPSIEETATERYWRDEVIARNELIEHLYDIMDRELGKVRKRNPIK